jgi:hypothetical protein
MHPAIAALDQALASAGQDVVLRRIVGRAPNTLNVDVTVRAVVRPFQSHELVGGISQTDSRVIMSPTQIANAQWPGGQPASSTVAIPSLPQVNDKIIVDGRVRNVEAPVNPISLNGTLVRIELRVSG